MITGKKTFGAGRFFGINNITAPTPCRALVPQDMSIDFKRNTKELHGENAFSVAVAGGEMSVTGKVTMGASQARMFGELLFADTISTGKITEQDKESGTVPASVSYVVTVTNSATWTVDLGVFDADLGTIMQRVAPGSEATGKYSVAAGAYTFAAADASKNVKISYLYTTASVGQTISMTNSLMGPAGAFTSVMAFLYGIEQDVLTLSNCISSDMGIATKGGDFAKPTFAFMAATDANDILGTFAFAQAA